MSRLVGWAVGFALVVGLSSPAGAEEVNAANRSAARKVALDGIAALEKGDVRVASEKLEKAYALLQVPSVALWSARALAKSGRLVEASERYLAAGRLDYGDGEAAVQEQAQRESAKELEELTARIPTLLIVIQGAAPRSATVTLDGEVVPAALLDEERPVNPGDHKLLAEEGGRRVEQTLNVSEGQKKTATLRFEGSAAPADAPVAAGGGALVADSTSPAQPSDSGAPRSRTSGRRVLAFSALVVGSAGLALGGVTGVLALTKRSELVEGDNCNDQSCNQLARAAVDDFRRLRTVSSVGFIAGGAVAALGLVLLITEPSRPAAAATNERRLALRVGAGGLQLAGGF